MNAQGVTEPEDVLALYNELQTWDKEKFLTMIENTDEFHKNYYIVRH